MKNNTTKQTIASAPPVVCDAKTCVEICSVASSGHFARIVARAASVTSHPDASSSATPGERSGSVRPHLVILIFRKNG